MAGGRLAAGAGGRRRCSAAAAAFRRGVEVMAGPGSFVGTRASGFGGWWRAGRARSTARLGGAGGGHGRRGGVARRRDARGNSERRVKACAWRTRRRARESSGADDAALGVHTDGAVANLATVTTHKDERAERATRGLDIFDQI